MELASGVNRFVIHCSVHQPVNDKIPGLGLGRLTVNGLPDMRHGQNKPGHGQHIWPVVHICFSKGNL